MLSSMNNIESINNKINDLLSIVKQNKYKEAISRVEDTGAYVNTPTRMSKNYSKYYNNNEE